MTRMSAGVFLSEGVELVRGSQRWRVVRARARVQTFHSLDDPNSTRSPYAASRCPMNSAPSITSCV